jgi:hypothetical protein
MDVTPQRGRLGRLAVACRFVASGRRRQGRAKEARAALEDRHPVKRDGPVNVSGSSDRSKRDTRAEVAREQKLPERKLRTGGL